MPPHTGTDPIHAPSPIPVSSASSQVTSLHINKPTTTASGTAPGQALHDSPPTGSQPVELLRSQRTRTPTERGRLFRDVVRQSQVLSTKIRQTKAAYKSPGRGKGQGKGKCRASTPPSEACDTSAEEEADTDDATSGEWVVDDKSDVVPTSDAGELEQEGYTYQTELENELFRNKLTRSLNQLIPGQRKNPSRHTLKEALKFIWRDQTSPVGATQQHSQVVMLSEQELDGGGGHHLNFAPQPASAQKRQFVLPKPGPSKHGRLDLSGTPSTVLDDPSPPRIPKPVFPDPLDPMRPVGLPLSSTGAGAGGCPPGLPVSVSVPIPALSWSPPHESPACCASAAQQNSPSPLPANFQPPSETQTQPEDTQTQPEDTQTQPENTQTQAENTQTQPENTQTQPENTQTRPENTYITFARGDVPPLPHIPSSSQATGALVNPAPNYRAALLDEMSRKFTANACHRACAQVIMKEHGSGPHGSTVNYGEPLEDDAQEIGTAENAAAGKPRKHKSKSGLNCQPGQPRQIATSAIIDLIAYTIACRPWETRYTNMIWGLEAYERRWDDELSGFEFEPLQPELLKEILNCVPGGRTTIKSNICAVVKTGYGFIKIPVTKEQLNSNIKLYEKLRENFHLKSLDEPYTQYENLLLQEAFVDRLFDATHSPCVVHHQYFNPVPVETIAFVLTMIEACICEWCTGKEFQEHLNSKQQLVMYKKHLDNLGRFLLRAPRRLNAMRRECLKSVREPEPEGKSWATIPVEDFREDTPMPADSQASRSGA